MLLRPVSGGAGLSGRRLVVVPDVMSLASPPLRTAIRALRPGTSKRPPSGRLRSSGNSTYITNNRPLA